MAKLNKLNTGVLNQVDEFLDDESRMSTRTGLQLSLKMTQALYESHNELITHIEEQNDRVNKNASSIKELKENNILLWAKAWPLKALALAVGVFVLQSLINWQGLRRPLFHWILKVFGIDIPIEVIP